jgi:hypothetical protein
MEDVWRVHGRWRVMGRNMSGMRDAGGRGIVDWGERMVRISRGSAGYGPGGWASTRLEIRRRVSSVVANRGQNGVEVGMTVAMAVHRRSRLAHKLSSGVGERRSSEVVRYSGRYLTSFLAINSHPCPVDHLSLYGVPEPSSPHPRHGYSVPYVANNFFFSFLSLITCPPICRASHAYYSLLYFITTHA